MPLIFSIYAAVGRLVSCSQRVREREREATSFWGGRVKFQVGSRVSPLGRVIICLFFFFFFPTSLYLFVVCTYSSIFSGKAKVFLKRVPFLSVPTRRFEPLQKNVGIICFKNRLRCLLLLPSLRLLCWVSWHLKPKYCAREHQICHVCKSIGTFYKN